VRAHHPTDATTDPRPNGRWEPEGTSHEAHYGLAKHRHGSVGAARAVRAVAAPTATKTTTATTAATALAAARAKVTALRTVTASQLNLRSAPRLAAAACRVLARGTRVGVVRSVKDGAAEPGTG